MTRAIDDFQEFFQILAGRLLAGKGTEEDGELGEQFLILEDVTGNTASIDSGVVEEFEPVVGALLEAELPGPGAQGALVARGGENPALDFAPVAGIMAVLEAKFTQAEAALRSQFFHKFSKHKSLTFVVVSRLPQSN